MKKWIAVCLVVLMAFAFTGCGLVEMLTGGKVAVNDEGIKIKGEDGEQLDVGSAKWPKTELAGAIPELKDGKVKASLTQDDSVVIYVEEVAQEKFDAYLGVIRASFTADSYEADLDDAYHYQGSNSQKVQVALIYSESEDFLTISVARQKAEEE